MEAAGFLYRKLFRLRGDAAYVLGMALAGYDVYIRDLHPYMIVVEKKHDEKADGEGDENPLHW